MTRMLFSWLKRRRRQKLLALAFPDLWRKHLRANVPLYQRLSDAERGKLEQLARVFVAEKHWEGCGGLELTEEMQVTIAGMACLLALGVEPNYYFQGVPTILVYPDKFLIPAEPDDDFLASDDHEVALGVAWHRGAILLSWRDVQEAGRDEDHTNVVLHEFAHHLDGLDGFVDGSPPLPGEAGRDWQRVMGQEYERLVAASRRGRATLLDQYGAEDPAEFFAVATECFFEQPRELKRRHPKLYAALGQFYQLDPLKWRE